MSIDLVGMPTYGGIILSDLTSTTTFRSLTSSRSLLKIPLIATLFLSGWFLMSFPTVEWEWSPQYTFITRDLLFIFPSGSVVTWNLPEKVGKILIERTLLPAAETSHLDKLEAEDLEYLEDSARDGQVKAALGHEPASQSAE